MPECFECVVRSKSVRLAMPSSSANSVPPNWKRYSMSQERVALDQVERYLADRLPIC